MCHSRSNLPTMTVLRAPTPAPPTSPGPRRGSGPEIFTFDPLPELAAVPTARASISRVHRKRSRRVLYPPMVSVAEVGSRGRARGGGEEVQTHLTSSLCCLLSGPSPAASRGF